MVAHAYSANTGKPKGSNHIVLCSEVQTIVGYRGRLCLRRNSKEKGGAEGRREERKRVEKIMISVQKSMKQKHI